VAVADLEAMRTNPGYEPDKVGEVVAGRLECFQRGRRRWPFPDGVAPHHLTTASEVGECGAERAVEPAEDMAGADANADAERIVTPRRCICFDPARPIGQAPLSSFALRVLQSRSRDVHTDAEDTGVGCQRLQQPHAGTAAEIENPPRVQRSQGVDDPLHTPAGYRRCNGMVTLGDVTDLTAIHRATMPVCSGAVSAMLGYLGVLVLGGAVAAWFWYRDDL
jgi:hypothetical protein